MADESIRERFLQLLEAAAREMSPSMYWGTARLVRREYIHPLENTTYPQVSILDTTEVKADAGVGGEMVPFGFTGATLSVVLHFADKAMGAVSRATLGGRWIADLERLAHSFDGNTETGALLHVRTTGNTLELTEIEAPLVLGVVNVEIGYRHTVGDPARGS